MSILLLKIESPPSYRSPLRCNEPWHLKFRHAALLHDYALSLTTTPRLDNACVYLFGCVR